MKPTLPAFDEVRADFEEIFGTGQLTLGPYVRRFEEKAAEYLEVKHAIGNPSATTGLVILASTLPGESEVILPAYTFSATYQALRWCGLKAVPVDCDERCQIDPREVTKALTSRTSAILGVHMFGHPADVDALEAIAREHELRLFFDSAHAFGGEWRGRKLGGFGDGEVFSLGPTKTMPTGEGGLLTTNDDDLAERLRLASNHGHPPGSLDCFCDGLNARLQEMNAVVGIHLLDGLDSWIRRRNELADRYDRAFTELPGISVAARHPEARSTVKDYPIFVAPEVARCSRDELAEALDARGIMTKKYYWPPIHRLKFARDEFRDVSCPRTEELAARVLALPLWSHMPFATQDLVIDAIHEICSP